VKITDDQLGETEIKDATGRPLVVYHGTSASFDTFSDNYLQSLGFHFGDPDQANHFAGQGTFARVIPVYLIIRSLIDLEASDAGWLNPKQTAIGLYIDDFLTAGEAISIIGSENLSLAAYRELESLEVRQERNKQIIGALETKGFDGIVYRNNQEPGDGVGRKSHLVFHASQIFSAITRECLCDDAPIWAV
jgi:ADP-Ribosyltransferase in polyvalent proteins